LINEKFDLVTAKELLRHSSVAITAPHYVENRKRGTTGLGALLAQDRKMLRWNKQLRKKQPKRYE